MTSADPIRPRKQIELDPEMLRGLQLVELELLEEVDRVCRAHDIPYCIIAGTLLGAVRHGGFIPWDDDADVAMLRADYERGSARRVVPISILISITSRTTWLRLAIAGAMASCVVPIRYSCARIRNICPTSRGYLSTYSRSTLFPNRMWVVF